ncbi:hypothetical protein O3P69_008308 [Scylla paramamosain]|uniref:C2H2-type domain-containing protein n=1 Tax=Scylla paramamosain TaxID=85552 RepID=A0AAW0SJ60_SCYPA
MPEPDTTLTCREDCHSTHCLRPFLHPLLPDGIAFLNFSFSDFSRRAVLVRLCWLGCAGEADGAGGAGKDGKTGLLSVWGGTSPTAAARRRGHSCPICSKAFETRYKLERHQLTHTGEKPYACPYCPHRCNQRDNLKAHIGSKHREYYDPNSVDI